MKSKLLFLPTFVYTISFTLILFMYPLGWSNLYPDLKGFLPIFLTLTALISLLIAIFQYKVLHIKPTRQNLSSGFVKRSLFFILIGYSLDFAYERNIPLVTTFLDSSYSYGDFNGIPTFHVILATFNIFFSILMFDRFIMDKRLKTIAEFLVTMIPSVLMMNRGAFMIVFFAALFVFLMRVERLKLKVLVAAGVILLIVLFLFGVVGNIRQPQMKEEKEYLLRVGGATDKFIDGRVPNEFYWSYIYIISPIGNLQNILDQKESNFNVNNLGVFATTQLFPDFISKRLVSIFGYTDIVEKDEGKEFLVTPLLNAQTLYFTPYFLLGIGGLIIMFVAVMFSAIIYPILLRSGSVFFVAGLASLNSIILLCTFANMWIAVGTVMLWPLIMDTMARISWRTIK